MQEVSITRIKSYKECLKKYEYSYIHELEPIVPAPALITGRNYHQKIEEIINTGDFEDEGNKTDTMAQAFKKFIYPNFKFKTAEEDFSIPLTDSINLIGRIDAFLEDGTPVEHKTSSSKPDDKYKYKLAWDDQVAAYMIATGTNKMLYTVCQKPTIRQRKNETELEYIERCRDWYDESKITAFYVYRSQEELQEKLQEFKDIAQEMESRSFFYRNPSHCRILNCPFEDICLDYEPGVEELGFRKKNHER